MAKPILCRSFCQIWVQGFSIKGLNEGNTYSATVSADSFQIQPGTYLLTRAGKNISPGKNSIGVIGLNEFAAPKPSSTEMFLRHEPFAEVSAGKAFTIHAKVVGIDTGRVSLQISRLGGGGPEARKYSYDKENSFGLYSRSSGRSCYTRRY